MDSNLRELYPEIAPSRQHDLEVGGGHTLYVEECGNPSGIPVIFLHGGPGSGCNENHRRYFDPGRYRVILVDQRGCNRSTPRGRTESNTTSDLIADLERIRELAGVERWLVYGGSWGATLGLLYAQAHPNRVLGMILRGTFLARQRDLDWFLRDGASRIFPDEWRRFMDIIPVTEQDDPVHACYQRVHGSDPIERERFARAWSDWSGRLATYLLPIAPASEPTDAGRMVDEVRIETHFARYRYFIEENQILDRTGQLPRVPVHIIHGRRDLVCPLESSWALHSAVPASELTVVANGGHLAGEPPMTDALLRATDAMAGKLGK